MTIISQAYAQAPTPDDAAAPSDQPVGAGDVLLPNMLLIIAIIGLFIVLVYLPQKRRNKEHNAMLSELGEGDKVVTTGGMVGTITNMPGDNEIIIETGEGHKVTVLKAAVTGKYGDIVQPPSSGGTTKESR